MLAHHQIPGLGMLVGTMGAAAEEAPGVSKKQPTEGGAYYVAGYYADWEALYG